MTQAEFQLAGVLMSSWKPSIVSRIKSIWYEYGFLRIMHKNDQKSFCCILAIPQSGSPLPSKGGLQTHYQRRSGVWWSIFGLRAGRCWKPEDPHLGSHLDPRWQGKVCLVQLASNWRLQSTVVALGLLTEQPRVRISTLLKFSRWSSKCSTPLDCLRLWKRHSSP